MRFTGQVEIARLICTTVDAGVPALAGRCYPDVAFDVEDIETYMVYSFEGGTQTEAFGAGAQRRQTVGYTVYAPVFVDDDAHLEEVLAVEEAVYNALGATGRMVAASGVSTAYVSDLDRRAATRTVELR